LGPATRQHPGSGVSKIGQQFFLLDSCLFNKPFRIIEKGDFALSRRLCTLNCKRVRDWFGVSTPHGTNTMGSFGQRMGNLFFRSQILVSLATGAVVAFTVLGAGLALIRFHGRGWPWWFHGVAVALITGLIAALLTRLYVRELSRREARRLAGERLSHEVCNALQILVQRMYLQPGQRAELEDEAIERIRTAAREMLPNILDIPINARPASPFFPGQEKKKRQSVSGSSAA
jgi:membrane protein implicated in regulation of membrane protease activity